MHGPSRQVVVDLCFRGVDADSPDKQIIHRGKLDELEPAAKRDGCVGARPSSRRLDT
jgi:hypothetical protein